MIAQLDFDYIKLRPYKLYNRMVSYIFFEGRPLTTKGQFINPFLFFLFDLEKRVTVKNKVIKPIFIIGTGRSGTTVLGTVLSMHRDVGFLNEPKALWHSAYKHEDIIGSYTQGPASYRLDKSDVTSEVIKSMHRLYGWYLNISRCKRIVDKYPELIFRVEFVRELFPDAKFIFLVRNGWDTCHSIDAWSQRLGSNDGQETHDWWGVNSRKWRLLVNQILVEDPDLVNHLSVITQFKKHTDMAAIEWILTMREGLRLTKKLPEVVYTVKYEDLAVSPRQTLRNIAQFCELDDDKTFFEYGDKILRPVKSKEPYELHPAIESTFKDVMISLGYTS